jgi:hypothetical protein
MAASQLVFFIGWFAAALAGGVFLAFAWERLYRKYGRR